jgi:hypothetical protein
MRCGLAAALPAHLKLRICIGGARSLAMSRALRVRDVHAWRFVREVMLMTRGAMNGPASLN